MSAPTADSVYESTADSALWQPSASKQVLQGDGAPWAPHPPFQGYSWRVVQPSNRNPASGAPTICRLTIWRQVVAVCTGTHVRNDTCAHIQLSFLVSKNLNLTGESGPKGYRVWQVQGRGGASPVGCRQRCAPPSVLVAARVRSSSSGCTYALWR